VTSLTRRDFLRSSALASASTLLPGASLAAPSDFSFILLGDLHFDRLEHHEMAWLEKHKPGDLSQIRNYSRITADVMPRLFETVHETANALRGGGPPPAFMVHVGDLVEGLCGSAELAARQNREALAFVGEHATGLPFIFTKGNHDVTGDGATEAFAEVFHPFLTQQRRLLDAAAAPSDSARYTVQHGPAQFYFFDAYDKQSLDWLEAALATRNAQHCFVVIHPPVIPYGARATWTVFGNDKETAKREKLLELLARQHAIVLGGHIHRFNYSVRQVGKERFAQLAVSSVINSADTKPQTVLRGLDAYTPEQITVEPNFSPETAEKRRAIYTAERPHMRAFEYADLPGHTVVKVQGGRVTAEIYTGITRQLFRTVDLTAELRA
jgi:UDP-2,3-diacylglucosamine pyrophosphatase LpxH